MQMYVRRPNDDKTYRSACARVCVCLCVVGACVGTGIIGLELSLNW